MCKHGVKANQMAAVCLVDRLERSSDCLQAFAVEHRRMCSGGANYTNYRSNVSWVCGVCRLQCALLEVAAYSQYCKTRSNKQAIGKKQEAMQISLKSKKCIRPLLINSSTR